ncbi:MAG: hypothetical protein R3D58_17035 [Saprospiraceae bacterium]
MDELSQEQRLAAEAIFDSCTTDGFTTPSRIFGKTLESGLDTDDITFAADFLKEHDLIDIRETKTQVDYLLSKKGARLKQAGKTLSDYLNEIDEQEAKQQEKERREDYKSDLQIQDLEFRMKTIEEMQERQKVFWDSGIRRDNRQRWQFWLTLILAAGGFLLGIINFVKDIILPK